MRWIRTMYAKACLDMVCYNKPTLYGGRGQMQDTLLHHLTVEPILHLTLSLF